MGRAGDEKQVISLQWPNCGCVVDGGSAMAAISVYIIIQQ